MRKRIRKRTPEEKALEQFLVVFFDNDRLPVPDGISHSIAIGDNAYVVSAPGLTAKEVRDAFGMLSEHHSSGIVVRMDTFSGVVDSHVIEEVESWARA